MDRVCPEDKESLPSPGIFVSWPDAGEFFLLPVYHSPFIRHLVIVQF